MKGAYQQLCYPVTIKPTMSPSALVKNDAVARDARTLHRASKEQLHEPVIFAIYTPWSRLCGKRAHSSTRLSDRAIAVRQIANRRSLLLKEQLVLKSVLYKNIGAGRSRWSVAVPHRQRCRVLPDASATYALHTDQART